MKIQLTEEGLKVNKWSCHNVTVDKLEDGTFEATMFDIKGVTKEIPVIDKTFGEQKTDWQGKRLFKYSKFKKVIKSKTFEYSGIEMKDYSRPDREKKKYLSATNGEKSNYINYYEPLEEVE